MEGDVGTINRFVDLSIFPDCSLETFTDPNYASISYTIYNTQLNHVLDAFPPTNDHCMGVTYTFVGITFVDPDDGLTKYVLDVFSETFVSFNSATRNLALYSEDNMYIGNNWDNYRVWTANIQAQNAAGNTFVAQIEVNLYKNCEFITLDGSDFAFSVASAEYTITDT